MFRWFYITSFDREKRADFKFPKNVEELKSLGIMLSEYQDTYYWEILIVMITAYIFLQSFMIPGSVFMSILLGYLFPFPLALALVSFCSAVGATCCYLLAGFIGSKLLTYLIPKEIEECRMLRYRHAMFFCICLLRISPLIPNWLVNVSSPIVEIPILHFFLGTLVALQEFGGIAGQVMLGSGVEFYATAVAHWSKWSTVIDYVGWGMCYACHQIGCHGERCLPRQVVDQVVGGQSEIWHEGILTLTRSLGHIGPVRLLGW
ncbi:unnamed protein product [Echinostoma caproni]|uniref:Transmembrane protein n=1 Tax=Echinostoma caproni TaxID=27848 RepID=A0A183A109_9TREM|nr:unnamed protein product [Echinostoma caproni]